MWTVGKPRSSQESVLKMHACASLGVYVYCRGLLDAKGNINYSNHFDQTALFSCAPRQDETLTAYLIKRGAKVNHWNKVF